MAPPTPPDDAPAPEGAGLLETLGDQVAALAARVAEIDTRMASVESGAPDQPVEVQLSAETVAQIAEALAALQAAGSQALDEAFKSATDDLTEALSHLVTAEISRTLADAGYDVAVTEAPEPVVADETVDDELPETEPVASSVRSAAESAAEPSLVTPLSGAAADRVEAAYDSIRDSGGGFADVADEDTEIADEEGASISGDQPPLGLEELDDLFLDALIRKEPLSA